MIYCKKISIITLFIACIILESNGQSPSHTLCESNEECRHMSNSFCFKKNGAKSGKCKCEDGFQRNMNECVPEPKIGDSCEKVSDCPGTTTVCSEYQRCICIEGLNTWMGKCYFKVELGGTCQADGNCHIEDGTTGGAFANCINGSCACSSGKHPSKDGTRCLSTRILNDSCNESEECTTADTICNGACQCKANFTISRDKTGCVNDFLASKPLACQADDDCKSNANCFKKTGALLGKCRCKEGFQMKNLNSYECISETKPGDTCEKNKDCADGRSSLLICDDNNTCTCAEGSTPCNGTCVIVTNVGGTCMEDSNCDISAKCEDGTCKCKKNEYPSEDGTRCIRKRNLGESCTQDEECFIPNTICNEKCECDKSFTLSRYAIDCVKAAVEFGEECTFDGQCSKVLDQSICDNGKCGCQTGFHGYKQRCVETKKTGEKCDNDDQCIYETRLENNVRCEGARCKCLYGTNEDSEDNSCKIARVAGFSSSSISLVGTANIYMFLLYVTSALRLLI